MSRSAESQLDAFDRKILKILQRDNSMSQKEIGGAVALSAAAVHKRIKRMTESVVIVGNISVVNPAAVGNAIIILVETEVLSETAE